MPCAQLLCAVFSAAILASIFFRAAKIISSRLRCSDACRSSLFELHPLPFFSASSASTVAPSFPLRLYRVIRSGCDGFSGCLVVAALAPDAGCPGGGGGWNVIGGC